MNDTELDLLNRLPNEAAIEQFQRCCGSDAWCRAMVMRRPFRNADELHRAADQVMDTLGEQDWKQAFDSHPRIGDLNSLRMKFSGNREWSAAEQSGMAESQEEILAELAEGNQEYYAKFGFIFIICASGKSAVELLAALKERLPLEPKFELLNASAEQRKITHLRIDKMVSNLT